MHKKRIMTDASEASKKHRHQGALSPVSALPSLVLPPPPSEEDGEEAGAVAALNEKMDGFNEMYKQTKEQRFSNRQALLRLENMKRDIEDVFLSTYPILYEFEVSSLDTSDDSKTTSYFFSDLNKCKELAGRLREFNAKSRMPMLTCHMLIHDCTKSDNDDLSSGFEQMSIHAFAKWNDVSYTFNDIVSDFSFVHNTKYDLDRHLACLASLVDPLTVADDDDDDEDDDEDEDEDEDDEDDDEDYVMEKMTADERMVMSSIGAQLLKINLEVGIW